MSRPRRLCHKKGSPEMLTLAKLKAVNAKGSYCVICGKPLVEIDLAFTTTKGCLICEDKLCKGEPLDTPKREYKRDAFLVKLDKLKEEMEKEGYTCLIIEDRAWQKGNDHLIGQSLTLKNLKDKASYIIAKTLLDWSLSKFSLHGYDDHQWQLGLNPTFFWKTGLLKDYTSP